MKNEELILFIHNVAQTGIVLKKAIETSDKKLLNRVFEYEEKSFDHAEKLISVENIFKTETEKILFIKEMLSVSDGFSRLTYLLKSKKLDDAEHFVSVLNDFVLCLEKIESMEYLLSFKTLKKIRNWMKKSISSNSLFDYALAETLESLFFSLKTSAEMIRIF